MGGLRLSGDHSATERPQRPWPARVVLPAVLAVAVLVRLRYVLAGDFPLNDGGMFYVMTREVLDSGFRLPMFTDYNGLHLPFAYPPLGFYLAALLSRLTGSDPLLWMRIVPFTFSVAAVAAGWLLARAVLSESRLAAAAGLALAVQPEAFAWQLMGGGLTRAPGYFFALCTLYLFWRALRAGGMRYAVLAGVSAALTVLSHLEAAYFVALSCLLFLVVCGITGARLRRAVVAAVVAGVGVAPWLLVVVQAHGLAPFRHAGETGRVAGALWAAGALLLGQLTREPFFPLILAFALLGVLTVWRTPWRWLPLWLVTVWVLMPRGGHIYASAPLALLAAVGAVWGLGRVMSMSEPPAPSPPLESQAGRAMLPSRLAGVLAAYAILAALLSGPVALAPLPGAERQAMQWIRGETAPVAQFLVVTGFGVDTTRGRGGGLDGLRGWGLDRGAEWFPALTGRMAPATPQGREWQPDFSGAVERYFALQQCALRDGRCLIEWADHYAPAARYVYIPKEPPSGPGWDGEGCCTALRASMRLGTLYRVVYDGPGATIAERVEDGPRS